MDNGLSPIGDIDSSSGTSDNNTNSGLQNGFTNQSVSYLNQSGNHRLTIWYFINRR